MELEEEHPMPEPMKLRQTAARKEEELRRFLAWWSPRYGWPTRNPERVKALDRTALRLAELQRCLELDTDGKGSKAIASTMSLVNQITPRTKRDPAWDVAEQLKLQLLWFRSNEEIAALLRSEESKAPVAPVPVRSVSPMYDGLGELAKRLENGDRSARERAIARLAEIHRQSVEDAWHGRANDALRARHLKVVSLLLLIPLMVTVLFALNLSIPDGQAGAPGDSRLKWLLAAVFKDPLIVTLSAGALGATLSGVIKLRDTNLRIRELRHFGAILVAQFLLGATAALVLYLIVSSKLIQLALLSEGIQDWRQAAVLGFLAGFSEPFFLKTLSGILTLTGEKVEKAPS